ncbi:hypothetical protein CFOL_v3_14861 [Cephalotus follicularis]|uniref:Uncharacterized protein n=1 Tax=Cephalotus follicularis TaxID=3775 RepID=A0A1Q3BTT9_CEPFO|nr:hypothetical protein CFOL_v3_14861 [Cephalotus follicularis]
MREVLPEFSLNDVHHNKNRVLQYFDMFIKLTNHKAFGAIRAQSLMPCDECSMQIWLKVNPQKTMQMSLKWSLMFWRFKYQIGMIILQLSCPGVMVKYMFPFRNLDSSSLISRKIVKQMLKRLLLKIVKQMLKKLLLKIHNYLNLELAAPEADAEENPAKNPELLNLELPTPELYRSFILTFAQAPKTPVTKIDIKDYINSNFGDWVEAVHLKKSSLS